MMDKETIDAILFTLSFLAAIIVAGLISVLLIAISSGGGNDGKYHDIHTTMKTQSKSTSSLVRYTKREPQRGYVSSIMKSIGF